MTKPRKLRRGDRATITLHVTVRHSRPWPSGAFKGRHWVSYRCDEFPGIIGSWRDELRALPRRKRGYRLAPPGGAKRVQLAEPWEKSR